MSRAKRGVSKDGNNGDISHPRAVYRAQATALRAPQDELVRIGFA